MTPRQWRMASAIPPLVQAERGLTEGQIAEMLYATSSEIHPVIGMLLGRGKLERCGDYLTVPGTPGSAA